MLKTASRNFWCGLLDSVRGCYKIFLLDRTPPTPGGDAYGQLGQANFGANSSSSQQQQQQMPVRTTLAMRRENRPKQRETSVQRPDEKPKAIFRLFQCIISNVLCILLFNYVLLPLIEISGSKCLQLFKTFFVKNELENEEELSDKYSWISTFFTNLFNALWVLPVFVITRIVNSLWFQDIANAALRRRAKPGSQMSFSRSVADFCYAILLETVFLVQTYFVGMLPLPYVNFLLKIVHTGLLYGLYSFEYVWMSQGIGMHQRLARIEHNYPYFFGFGLLLTLITMIPSSAILSGCVFGLFFPVFIVSSFEARPPVTTDWEPVRFFWPSVIVCDKVSMSVLHKARAKVHFAPVRYAE